jgi:hypothetical protein
MIFKKVLFPFGLLFVLASCASSKVLESDKPMHLPITPQPQDHSSAHSAVPIVPSAKPELSRPATATPVPAGVKATPELKCVNSVGNVLTPDSPEFKACMMKPNKNNTPRK